MKTLLERFLRYVQIDTQADEKATTYPSSPGQLVLGRMLCDELLALGYVDARITEFGVVHGLGQIFHRAFLVRQTKRIQEFESTHPALAFFADERWKPLLTEIPFYGFFETRPLFAVSRR